MRESALLDHTIIVTYRNSVNTGKQAMTRYSCNVQEQEELLCFGISQKMCGSTQDMKYRSQKL